MRHLNKEVWPHNIIVRTEDFEIDDWCLASIGKRYVDWYSYRMDYDSKIYAFKTSESLLAFKLAWGNK